MLARHTTRGYQMRNLKAVVAAMILGAGAAKDATALDLRVDPDVVAGREHLMSLTPVVDELAWSAFFPAGTHVDGNIFPFLDAASHSFVLADASNATAVRAANGDSLTLANWVDGPGFDGPEDSPAADFAVSGFESFDVNTTRDTRVFGFTVVTGFGNLMSEVDETGATFQLTAIDANGVALDTVEFSLLGGLGRQEAFVSVASFVPFRTLQVREIGGTGKDQYFGNFLLSDSLPVLAAVVDVEPGSRQNKIVLNGRMNVEVAVLTTDTFDALNVEELSVRMGDAETGVKTAPVSSRLEDSDRDGRMDVVCEFDPNDLAMSGAVSVFTTVVEVTGLTHNDRGFRGTDAVTVVMRGKK
jgi:hypothetical protein